MANKHSFSKLNKNINNCIVVQFTSKHLGVKIVLNFKKLAKDFYISKGRVLKRKTKGFNEIKTVEMNDFKNYKGLLVYYILFKIYNFFLSPNFTLL